MANPTPRPGRGAQRQWRQIVVEARPVDNRRRECQWCGDVVSAGEWEAVPG